MGPSSISQMSIILRSLTTARLPARLAPFPFRERERGRYTHFYLFITRGLQSRIFFSSSSSRKKKPFCKTDWPSSGSSPAATGCIQVRGKVSASRGITKVFLFAIALMSFVVQVPVSSRNSLYNSVYSRCCTEISRLPCTDKSREWDQTPPGSISRDIVSQLIQGRRRNESGVWINVLKWDPTQAAAAPLFNSCKNFHPIFKRREEKNASTRDCTCAVDTHSTKGEIVVGRATRKNTLNGAGRWNSEDTQRMKNENISLDRETF